MNKDDDYILRKEKEIYLRCLGLSYNGGYPEITDMKELELCNVVCDYSDYVAEKVNKNQIPKTIFKFIEESSNLIFNAHLYQMKVGDTVYYWGDNNTCIKTQIREKWVEKNGQVHCYVFGEEEDLIAGRLYYSEREWR